MAERWRYRVSGVSGRRLEERVPRIIRATVYLHSRHYSSAAYAIFSERAHWRTLNASSYDCIIDCIPTCQQCPPNRSIVVELFNFTILRLMNIKERVPSLRNFNGIIIKTGSKRIHVSVNFAQCIPKRFCLKGFRKITRDFSSNGRASTLFMLKNLRNEYY